MVMTTGAHLNPAVSLAMACVGKFPLFKVIFYWVAQYLGALAGAACVLGVYSGTHFCDLVAVRDVDIGQLFVYSQMQSITRAKET